ncbi:MAG: protein translocase subunit SecF, partial [Patescibacteria group bacterium]|nr:protein translocase subunit SecF [Patescibacteria group bacterium]
MNIIGKRKIWFTISGILIVLSIFALAFWGLNLGIDFKGGTLMELAFTKNVTSQEVKNALNNLDFAKGLTVQKTGEGSIILRLPPLNKENELKVKTILFEKIGESQELKLETVGPTVSKDLTKKAIIAIAIAAAAIILYVAWAFRTVPKPANSWHFGISTIAALAHDIIIPLGLFSILGHFLGYEIDPLFITAILTVMGFSVHDTIVVFDRIRENLKRHPGADFEKTVNDSVNQTLARSLNTSLTVFLVLLAMYLLGGKSIQPFI